ncbi:MAG TPA: STAS domain-containing protein [Burkholderiales bacterium]|nr:STAS domain-containing protein [Burkholderiales bacterium]
MIRRDGMRMIVGGPVTLANVRRVVEEGERQLDEGVRTVDLSEVSEMDSSLLAALFAWMRHARRREREIGFTNLPEPLRAIARLYGVDGLLPEAQR